MREAAVGAPTDPAVAKRLPPVDSPAGALPPTRTRFAGSVWSAAAVATTTTTIAKVRARARMRLLGALQRVVAAGQRTATGWRALAASAGVRLSCLSLECMISKRLFRRGTPLLCLEAEPDGESRFRSLDDVHTKRLASHPNLASSMTEILKIGRGSERGERVVITVVGPLAASAPRVASASRRARPAAAPTPSACLTAPPHQHRKHTRSRDRDRRHDSEGLGCGLCPTCPEIQ